MSFVCCRFTAGQRISQVIVPGACGELPCCSDGDDHSIAAILGCTLGTGLRRQGLDRPDTVVATVCSGSMVALGWVKSEASHVRALGGALQGWDRS